MKFFQKIKSSWKWWLPPIAIAVVYFLVQFSQLSEYGVSWDEPLHRNWGKLFAYFWKSGDRTLLDMMPGHGIDYGPLYFYLNFLLSEYLYTSGLFTYVAANHVLTLIVSAFCVGFTFVLGRYFGGPRVGYLSILFLLCFPQFIAHAHYNPKDIPLMAAVLVTSLVFLRAIQTSSNALFIIFAFLFGMSMAVKINAILMAPVFVLSYVIWCIPHFRQKVPGFLRSQLIVVLSCALAWLIGLYFFWPSAWGDLLLIPRALKFFAGTDFWAGHVLFFGKEYAGAALPWYYTIFEYATAMPVLTLLAFFVGLVVMTVRSKRLMRTDHFFLILWILFPLVFSVKPGLVRYDGIRQFYFILPAIVVTAAIGFDWLLTVLQQKSRKPHATKVFLALVFFSLITQVAILHPYEGSYRNELLQYAYPKSMDREFQIEYWGATYKQGMEWLMANAEQNPVICVPTAGILVTWYPWREDFEFECSDRANYVMFFTRYSDAGVYEALKNPVFSIERMKSPLLLVYKVK